MAKNQGQVDDIDDVLGDVFQHNPVPPKVPQKRATPEPPKSNIVDVNFDDLIDESLPEGGDDESDPITEAFGPDPIGPNKQKEARREQPQPPQRRTPQPPPRRAPAPQTAKPGPAPERRAPQKPEPAKEVNRRNEPVPAPRPEESSPVNIRPEVTQQIVNNERSHRDYQGEEKWKNFFRPIRENLSTVIIVSGTEGAGKTDWAIRNMPGPLYLLDTEGEHNLHTAREVAREVGKQIYGFAIETDPTQRPAKLWFSGSTGLWQQIEDAGIALRDAPPGTFILDSGSDVLAMVISQLNVDWDRGNDAFPPMLYGQVYGVLSSFISSIRRQHNVVITAKIKEIWRDNKPTGKFERSIWNTAEYLAEHLITIRMNGTERLYDFRRKKQPNVVTLPYPVTWDFIENGVPDDVIQEADYHEKVRRLKKAISLLSALNVSFPSDIPDNMEELEARLEEANTAYTKAEAQRRAEKAARRMPPGGKQAPPKKKEETGK